MRSLNTTRHSCRLRLFLVFVLMLLLHVKQIAGDYDELMTFVCVLCAGAFLL